MKLIHYIGARYCLVALLVVLVSSNSSCINDDGIVPPAEQEEDNVVQVNPEDRLPQVSINTNGALIVDEPKINAQMTINTPNGVDFEGKIGIEIRGKSSQMFPKKSFGFETRDADDEDLDLSLLGLPEESDWIFYAPYSDKSLIRNKLIYDLSNEIGRYASRSQFVEVTINDFYQGVYVFMEKLKRDSERIDVNKLNEDEISGEDLTGGYILKIDKADGPSFGTDYTDFNSFPSSYTPNNSNAGQSVRFLYEHPKEEDITVEQKAYISGYMQQFEDALASDDFADPLVGYAAFIDADSFIDFFLLNELANNVDGYRLSTFLQKDKNGKLQMGPIWDFNLAFGNADYCSGGETNVWAYKFNERCPGDFWQIPFWWDRLLQDPAFVNQLKERWNTLRSGPFSQTSIHAKIDADIAMLTKAGAIGNNFNTWRILGTYIWPNNFVGSSHDEEVDYLKGWINDRLTWLDGTIEAL
ncbi:CotH kinase family protein [Maribacter algicola]|uniref:CotH kinase family protein n=1 Tax=Meishania litoralis TaxID=3434685 RepID=A0ACC7LGU3_9FLAO